MRKIISIIIALSILQFGHSESLELSDNLVKDYKKVCSLKDQSSVENLLKTIIACQNTGKSIELLPLTFLATDQHDKLLNFPIPKGMAELRAEMAKFSSNQDKYYDLTQQKEKLEQTIQDQNKDKIASLTQEINELQEQTILPSELALKSIKKITLEETEENMPIQGAQFGYATYNAIVQNPDIPNTIEENQIAFILIDDKYYLVLVPIIAPN